MEKSPGFDAKASVWLLIAPNQDFTSIRSRARFEALFQLSTPVKYCLGETF
jgi:hypothetical protein